MITLDASTADLITHTGKPVREVSETELLDTLRTALREYAGRQQDRAESVWDNDEYDAQDAAEEERTCARQAAIARALLDGLA